MIVASTEDFRSAVTASTDKPLVAYFSASWDNSCKLVQPTVDELAEQLQDVATFVQVDAEKMETLCEVEAVDNFPHFRVYKAGKVLGDMSSSKADKVEEFIRGLVTRESNAEAPEGEEQAEDAEDVEVEAVEEQQTVEDAPNEAELQEEGRESKKRQDRDDMEAEDEREVKKAKTEEESPEASTEEAVGANEMLEVASEEAQKEQEEAAADGAVDSTDVVADDDVGSVEGTGNAGDSAEEAAPADTVDGDEETAKPAEDATSGTKVAAGEDEAAVADAAAA